MSSIAASLNSPEDIKPNRFGSAEGLLRVLARRMSDTDHSDTSLTLQMNAIANRLHEEDLYNFDQENSEDLENLIGLMQLADYVINIAENKHESKKILSLANEIQSSDEKLSSIIDVMILIAKNEYKTSIKSLSHILTHSL